MNSFLQSIATFICLPSGGGKTYNSRVLRTHGWNVLDIDDFWVNERLASAKKARKNGERTDYQQENRILGDIINRRQQGLRYLQLDVLFLHHPGMLEFAQPLEASDPRLHIILPSEELVLANLELRGGDKRSPEDRLLNVRQLTAYAERHAGDLGDRVLVCASQAEVSRAVAKVATRFVN